VDPAPKASGAFREGDPHSFWGRSPEKQSRAVRRAQEMARSGAREIRARRSNGSQNGIDGTRKRAQIRLADLPRCGGSSRDNCDDRIVLRYEQRLGDASWKSRFTAVTSRRCSYRSRLNSG
jgi:hypothetical protein